MREEAQARVKFARRKTTYIHITTSLERCTGCDRVVGGETITLADADTAAIVGCPECSPVKSLG